MSERLDFEIVCPNDHDQTVTFSRDEFEKTLKSGALVRSERKPRG
jgi:DNA polymerase III sliding clamp (beta) subunit (PCNA family)